MSKRKLNYLNLSIEPYKKIWDVQLILHKLRFENKINDTLILLEHKHVYTLGKIAKQEHLLFPAELLKNQNIDIFEIDRGGDITYHGPGQIVGYPIIHLSDWKEDIHLYLRELEEVIIKTLQEFGITSNRLSGLTGVWIGDEKICAIGIKVSKWVTMHGFAFNVNTDLSYFNKIIPCGIRDKGVTSLQKVLFREINIEEVKEVLLKNFIKIFSYDEIENFTSIDLLLNSSQKKNLEGTYVV